MRLFKRILWITVTTLLSLVALACILIQTPMVQTRVSQAVTENLLSKLDAEVQFSKISLRPFHTIVIRDLVLIDREPAAIPEEYAESFQAQEWEPYDTIAKLQYAVARFSLGGLIKALDGEAFEIDKATARNGFFYLVTEPNKKTNIDRVFRDKSKPKVYNEKISTRGVFRIKKAKVRNLEYRMLNISHSLKALPEGCINFDNLQVKEVNAEGCNIGLRNNIVTATLEKCSFVEKSGYICENISASAAITAKGGGQAVIENIHLKDPWSEFVLPHYIMSWGHRFDFKDYLGKVGMDFLFEETKISSHSLGFFIPEMKNMDLEIIADGGVYGPASGFRFDNFRIRTSDESFAIDLSGDVSGLPDLKKTTLNLRLDNCSTTVDGLEKLISGATGNPGFHFGKVRPDTWASVFGRFRGPVNNLGVSVYLRSGIGDLLTDVNVRNVISADRGIEINGDLISEDLDLGTILNNDNLGECTMGSVLKARIGKKDDAILNIESLKVDKLGFNGHDYCNIKADGLLSREKFMGRIVSHDPACDFMFDGLFSLAPKSEEAIYRFYAKVNKADLHKMNFDKRDSSSISFITDANFTRTKSNMLGSVNVDKLVLQSRERNDVGDIRILSESTDGTYRISLKSDFADAEYTASKPITSFPGDFSLLTLQREIPALFKNHAGKWDGSTYNMSLQCKDMTPVTNFLKPGLYVDRNSSLSLTIGKDGSTSGEIRSRRIAMKENYMKDLELTLSNAGSNLISGLSCSEINLATMLFQNSNMRLFVNDNEFGAGFDFENNDEMVQSGEFVARGDVWRDQMGELCVDLGILPSGFFLNNQEWSIMPAEISLRGGDVFVDGFQLTNGEQAIFVDGGISGKGCDTLDIAMENFKLSAISPFLSKEDMRLSGATTGTAMITSDGQKKKKGILMDFFVKDASFAGTGFGDLIASSKWNGESESFDIEVENDLGDRNSLKAKAQYFPAMKSLKAVADLDRQDITCLKDLITGVFDEVGGTISGHVEANGPIDSLELRSRGARIDADLMVGYIHVPYHVNGGFHVDSHGLHFDDIPLNDEYRGTGTVRGSVYWDHLKNLELGIHIEAVNCEAIAKPGSDGEGYYCNAFGTGTVDISGPLDDILVDVDMFSSDRSKFGVLLESSAKNSNSGLLSFKEPEVEIVVDPYEEMMKKLHRQEIGKKNEGVSVRLLIHATPMAEAMIEIDKDTGSAITGRGNGTIDVDLRPGRPIDLKGDYTLDEGSLRMNLMGIASRNFTINAGSSIKFNGDVQDSELNVDAIYKTKASLNTLISDTTSVNSRRNIDCFLKVTEKLREPKVSFDISVPDLDPSIKAKVENALSTEDKIQRQVIALLVMNNFLPDEQNGINNNSTASSALYSNAANILMNQVNSIFTRLNIPLDLGLNYQQNNRGKDVFDVNVSTQLFNNRVLINGNIGNRQYKTADNSEFAGDIDIEIKLDRAGAFRLNLFSHSADQYSNYLDNLQRNGLGVAYQQEFNHVGEVFRYMFASRKKKEKHEAEEIQRKQEEGYKTIVIE